MDEVHDERILHYAMVNFIIFIVFLAPTIKKPGGTPPSYAFHGFSGHWMYFYASGLALLTAAYRRGVSNLQQKCMNDHPVGFNDKFCSVCGISIDSSQANKASL
jgi:hypothetical protein